MVSPVGTPIPSQPVRTQARHLPLRATWLWLLLGLTPAVAHAAARHASELDETAPRCEALMSEARSQAAILSYPRIEVQGVRAPSFDALGHLDPVVAEGFQARAALSLSVVDIIRGRGLIGLADAQCERWLAGQALAQVLRQGTAYGRAEALRAQIARLERNLPRAREILDEAEQRLERAAATIMEVDEVELRVLQMTSRLDELRGDLAMLEAQGFTEPGMPLEPNLQRYEAASAQVHREESKQRRLAAWRAEVRGGVTPAPEPDWFGAIALTYSLGGPRQGRAERRALDAHQADLLQNDDELRRQVETFTQAMRDSAVHLRTQLERVRERLALYRDREARERDHDRMRRFLAQIELRRLELEAQEAYLATLLEQREPMGRAP